MMIRLATAWLALCGPAVAAEMTHGPTVGHTTHTSTRVWVRADAECDLRVALAPEGGGREILSETVRLVETDNFCGSARVQGLTAGTTYRYRVILDGRQQEPPVAQSLTTFPPPGEPGLIRVGFGHSLIGPGEQTVWRAVKAKNPDLFILMGDNIYSNSTEPRKQRRMYLEFRADPHFRAFGAVTPIYAVWDDHDYGKNNSDRTQPGKERSLKTFNEIWPNPPSQAAGAPGTWTRFTVGRAEFFLLDVRYHRSPNEDPDGPEKTMLGTPQRDWLIDAVLRSKATFKFPVSGSSWNCGGVEAWNHRFVHEYDFILTRLAAKRAPGVILLGGDQHHCKIGVRPGESWGGYDLHEWMAGQLWNREETGQIQGNPRGFGIVTIQTKSTPATARLEFFDQQGKPRQGRRIPYTTPGALRALWDSPPGTTGQPPRSIDGELRPKTSGPLWESLPAATGETLTEADLNWPKSR